MDTSLTAANRTGNTEPAQYVRRHDDHGAGWYSRKWIGAITPTRFVRKITDGGPA
jgi:hypothetical protein